MTELKLSSPWQVYYRQVEALFGVDPQVHVSLDQDSMELTLRVDDEVKADAISQLLPTVKEFGNVKLKINVVPSNTDSWKAQVIAKAFKDSPALVDIQTIQVEEMSNPMCFVVFKKEVVQYFSDSAGDIHGLTSTLYQDLAKQLIDADGIYYCTDNEMN